MAWAGSAPRTRPTVLVGCHPPTPRVIVIYTLLPSIPIRLCRIALAQTAKLLAVGVRLLACIVLCIIVIMCVLRNLPWTEESAEAPLIKLSVYESSSIHTSAAAASCWLGSGCCHCDAAFPRADVGGVPLRLVTCLVALAGPLRRLLSLRRLAGCRSRCSRVPPSALQSHCAWERCLLCAVPGGLGAVSGSGVAASSSVVGHGCGAASSRGVGNGFLLPKGRRPRFQRTGRWPPPRAAVWPTYMYQHATSADSRVQALCKMKLSERRKCGAVLLKITNQ